MPTGREFMDFEVSRTSRHNLVLARRDLQKFSRSISSFRRLFQVIRDEVLIPSIDLNFEKGGRGTTSGLSVPETLALNRKQKGTWAPLSPLSVAKRDRRAKKGMSVSYTPLTLTGELRRVATQRTRWDVQKNKMTYGNWPNRRTALKSRNDIGFVNKESYADVPARPFAMIQQQDATKIYKLADDWVRHHAQFVDNRSAIYRWDFGRFRSDRFSRTPGHIGRKSVRI